MKVHLTPLELDVMKAVWRHPPVTVREVHAAVLPSRNLAYTTIMTIMDRLFHKGFLTRIKKSRTHHYEPSVTYEDARDDALDHLVAAYFGGSREDLREFLRGNGSSDYDRHTDVFHSPSSTAMDETLL